VGAGAPHENVDLLPNGFDRSSGVPEVGVSAAELPNRLVAPLVGAFDVASAGFAPKKEVDEGPEEGNVNPDDFAAAVVPSDGVNPPEMGAAEVEVLGEVAG
jgi:hypothetical protein